MNTFNEKMAYTPRNKFFKSEIILEGYSNDRS